MILRSSKEANKLQKLGFSPNLFCSPDEPSIWLKHCEMYNMKWLKNSYGTIVHKDFTKFFKKVDNAQARKVEEKLCLSVLKDHTNLLECRLYPRQYIVTYSPYGPYDPYSKEIKEYPYDLYVINPNFLDYYAFVQDGKLRNVNDKINFAVTLMEPEQIEFINNAIYEVTGLFEVFTKVPL